MNRAGRLSAGRWAALLFAASLAPGAVVAAGCQSDSDCKPGTRCLFARNRDGGACASWSPSSRIDLQSAVVPLHQRGGTGFPCQSTLDCLPRYACYKLGHHLEGQCLR